MYFPPCRFLLLAIVCISLVSGARGQAAGAAGAAAAAAAGAVGDAAGASGSPVVALLLQLVGGGQDALRMLRRMIKATNRVYQAVSPELGAIGCMRKAIFSPVTPPFLKPPWPTEGWAALGKRKRFKRTVPGSWLGGGNPAPPERPFLLINGALAPTQPPKLGDLLEDFLGDALGDPSIIEAWRDLRSSWFGVVSVRMAKCVRTYFKQRFWRWVERD